MGGGGRVEGVSSGGGQEGERSVENGEMGGRKEDF